MCGFNSVQFEKENHASHQNKSFCKTMIKFGKTNQREELWKKYWTNRDQYG